MKKQIASSFIMFAVGYGITYLGVSWALGEWMPSPFNPLAWSSDARLSAFIWVLICLGVGVVGVLEEKIKEKTRDVS